MTNNDVTIISDLQFTQDRGTDTRTRGTERPEVLVSFRVARLKLYYKYPKFESSSLLFGLQGWHGFIHRNFIQLYLFLVGKSQLEMAKTVLQI